MDELPEQIHARLVALETEIMNLRQGYIVTNERYSNALIALRVLTTHSMDAAKRAAASAKKCVIAVQRALDAARQASDRSADRTVEFAVAAAEASAEAAAEAVKLSHAASAYIRTAKH